MNQRLTFHPTFLDYPQRLSNDSFFSFVVWCIDANPGGGGGESLSSEKFVYLFVFVTLHIGIFQHVSNGESKVMLRSINRLYARPELALRHP